MPTQRYSETSQGNIAVTLSLALLMCLNDAVDEQDRYDSAEEAGSEISEDSTDPIIRDTPPKNGETDR